jgi:hypothetical protein
MLKQRVAQKITNGQGTKVTAVPTLMYSIHMHLLVVMRELVSNEEWVEPGFSMYYPAKKINSQDMCPKF